MSTYPPPREAYPEWPDVDPEGLPPVYAKALGMRQALVREIERYIERGWAASQQDFAKRAGIGETVLRRWISGERWPVVHTVAAAEAVLETSLWPHQVSRKPHLRSKGGYDYP